MHLDNTLTLGSFTAVVPSALMRVAAWRRRLDWETVRGLSLLFSVIFVLIMAVVAVLALQPRTWK